MNDEYDFNINNEKQIYLLEFHEYTTVADIKIDLRHEFGIKDNDEIEINYENIKFQDTDKLTDFFDFIDYVTLFKKENVEFINCDEILNPLPYDIFYFRIIYVHKLYYKCQTFIKTFKLNFERNILNEFVNAFNGTKRTIEKRVFYYINEKLEELLEIFCNKTLNLLEEIK